MVEHYVRDVGAAGSNPVIPTIILNAQWLSVVHLKYLVIPGCSAGGSALDWGSRGRRFKSCHSDQNRLKSRFQAGFLMSFTEIGASLIFDEKFTNQEVSKNENFNENKHKRGRIF